MPANANNQQLTYRQIANLRVLVHSHAGTVVHAFAECVRGQRRLTAAQIQAGKVLLAKVLPDLSAVQVDHGGDGGVQINIVRLSEPRGAHDTPTPSLTQGVPTTIAPRRPGTAEAAVVQETGGKPQGIRPE